MNTTAIISWTNLCERLGMCLLEDMISLLSGAYARESKIFHTGGKSVTCHGL